MTMCEVPWPVRFAEVIVYSGVPRTKPRLVRSPRGRWYFDPPSVQKARAQVMAYLAKKYGVTLREEPRRRCKARKPPKRRRGTSR